MVRSFFGDSHSDIGRQRKKQTIDSVYGSINTRGRCLGLELSNLGMHGLLASNAVVFATCAAYRSMPSCGAQEQACRWRIDAVLCRFGPTLFALSVSVIDINLKSCRSETGPELTSISVTICRGARISAADGIFSKRKLPYLSTVAPDFLSWEVVAGDQLICCGNKVPKGRQTAGNVHSCLPQIH